MAAALGGALNQMVSLGLADKVLTDNPSITFWRHVIKRHTNFAMESQALDFNHGAANFGSTPTCSVDRIGDLLYWMYVRVDLPGIGLEYDGSIIDEDVQVNGESIEPYWTHAVGQALIENVSIFIGGQVIDTMCSEFMYIWEELSGAPGKRLQEMTGKFDAVYSLQVLSRQPRTLYIPLYFWFSLNSGLALPMVSLQFHSIKVSVGFKPYLKLVKLPTGAMQAPYNFVLTNIKKRALFRPNYYVGAAQPVSDLSDFSTSSISAHICVTYIYLDQKERKKFAEGAFELVIPQHQEHKVTVEQTVSGVNSVGTDKVQSIDLNFNHTIMELFWVLRLKCHDEFNSVTNPITSNYNEWFNFTGPKDIVTKLPIDPVKTARLTLNNANRFEVREGRYFRLLQPYQHHTNIPQKFIYCYSFALQPQDHQPSGSCNFSRIDSTKLDLTIDGRCFYGPSTSEGTDGNSSVTCFVFARNWNVLRFKFGLGGVRFAN